MHIRMPRSRSWASQGGISPIEQEQVLNINNDNSPKESRQAVQESSQGQHGAEERDTEKKDRDKRQRLRQPTLQWPPDRVTVKESVQEQDEKREERPPEGTWVTGGRKEDNQRYRDFLKYCEDRREEERMLQEADKSRKEDARRREEHWMLLRLCVKELKEGEHK